MVFGCFVVRVFCLPLCIQHNISCETTTNKQLTFACAKHNMDKVNIECVFLLFSFLFLMRFRSDFFCFGCSKTVCNRRLSLKFSQNDSFFFSHFFVLFDDLSSVMSFTFCAYFAVYLSLIFFSLASSLHILFMHTNMKTI